MATRIRTNDFDIIAAKRQATSTLALDVIRRRDGAAVFSGDLPLIVASQLVEVIQTETKAEAATDSPPPKVDAPQEEPAKKPPRKSARKKA